jgi:hypothetical protein
LFPFTEVGTLHQKKLSPELLVIGNPGMKDMSSLYMARIATIGWATFGRRISGSQIGGNGHIPDTALTQEVCAQLSAAMN